VLHRAGLAEPEPPARPPMRLFEPEGSLRRRVR
jgi:hypothetical protein